MTKVFLDCGSHLGEGFQEFIEILGITENWQCHLFEPNTSCYERIRVLANDWITVHKVAVWDKNSTVEFRAELSGMTGINDGLCSTILNKTQYPFQRNDLQETYQVPTIDLSEFISTNTKPDDEVYIKLDIEGSEFDVVKKLLASGVMDRIRYMAIEWHAWGIVENKTYYQDLEKELKQQLQSHKLTLIDWK